MLGQALRLAYSLSGGTAVLLDGTALLWQRKELVLKLVSSRVAVRGETVGRGLARLGQALDVPTRFEADLEA